MDQFEFDEDVVNEEEYRNNLPNLSKEKFLSMGMFFGHFANLVVNRLTGSRHIHQHMN